MRKGERSQEKHFQLQNTYTGNCLLFAQFAREVLHILDIEFRLFPGHEVPTTGKLGKMHQVDLACSPFTR